MSHRDLRPVKITSIPVSVFAKKKFRPAKVKPGSLVRLTKAPKAVKSTTRVICGLVSARFGIPKNVCTLAADSLIAAGKSLDFDSIASKAKDLMRRMIPAAGGSSSREGTWEPTSIAGVSAPVAVAHPIRKTSKPRMRNTGNGVTIRHSEMLGAIVSGNPSSNVTAFRCFGLRANPGITSIFPWLSSVAVNYEKYRFRSLSFTLIPLVSTNFSGRIGVGFDYDSSDLAPGNRQEFYSLSNHSETMPWQATGISVKCDGQFRFTGTHASADNKLIDQGQVILMSDSVSNGSTIAAAIPLYDLIVDYDVELIQPQQALFSTQAFVSTSNLIPGVSLATGSDLTQAVGPNVITGTTVTASKVSMFFPAGTYTIATEMAFTSGAPTLSVTTPSTTTTFKAVESHGGGTSLSITCVAATADFQLDFTLSGTAFNANVGLICCASGRGLEADHFMAIVSLDGALDLSSPFQSSTSTVHLSHKTKRPSVVLGPHTFGDKWKVPKNGFYTPTDVRFVVTPHISESAGVMATVKLIDGSDMSPSRVLYKSQEFNLGHGLTMEGSQLPYCLPVGEYPIQFEVTVSRSQFAVTRTMFSTSLEWRMMWSPTPLSRVKSVFATAHEKVLEAEPSFKLKKIPKNTSKGPRAVNGLGPPPKGSLCNGGTIVGLVTDGCVGLQTEC